MSIDWITVAAQIANFLVLIWLLKRFLYRPILDGIDAREAEIKARMQEAAEAEALAKTTEASYRAQIEAMHAAQSDVSERCAKRPRQSVTRFWPRPTPAWTKSAKAGRRI
jgi:F-type H+-transporting ATPase subunit b